MLSLVTLKSLMKIWILKHITYKNEIADWKKIGNAMKMWKVIVGLLCESNIVITCFFFLLKFPQIISFIIYKEEYKTYLLGELWDIGNAWRVFEVCSNWMLITIVLIAFEWIFIITVFIILEVNVHHIYFETN